MSAKILDALVAHFKQLDNCPVCGAFGVDVEDFSPDVFDFVVEARYSCGAAVKVSKGGTLDVGTACPEALRQKLDEIETEIAEAIEDAAA